ncbi:MAG TPA: c-type cytochrome, partial [Bryobacteraceae bacterium]|nr:c-type cytochrome [Bryobacteraceae bacterium]
MKLPACFNRIFVSACLIFVSHANADDAQSGAPRVSFADASHSTLLLDVAGKQYLVDVAAGSVREAGTSAPQTSSTQAPKPGSSAAAALFQQNCAGCHGTDGKGTRSAGTPDFTNRSIQSGLSDQQIIDTIRNGKPGRMPAWAGKLSDAQISELATYIRSLPAAAPSSSTTKQETATAPGVYQPGDDVLVSLPTGKATDRHGVYVNFAHRFMDTAFTGPG